MANRYWVGGTASWDGTAGTKWATTSGGAGGASVPTTADDVFLDANSGASTVTIATGNTGAKSITCTGFTGTLAGTADITVAGSMTLATGMTFTYSGITTFTATGTIVSAGKSWPYIININGAGITVTLGDALQGTNCLLVVDQGTFNTANYSVTISGLTSDSTSTRTVQLGSSTVSLSRSSPLDFNPSTGLTFSSGTSQINLTNEGGPNISAYSALTFYNVSFTGTTDSYDCSIIGTGLTFNNLTLTSPTTGMRRLDLHGDITVNGTFTAAGSSAIGRCCVRSNATTIGTVRTITAAAVSANDCDFHYITIAGAAAPIAPTRAGNCGGNSGITFPAAKTVYRVGTSSGYYGSSSWATTSGGTGSNNNYPLPQDTAIINDSTTGTQITTSQSCNIGTLDFSTRTTSYTFSVNDDTRIFSALVLSSAITPAGAFNILSFEGNGTMTLTSAGRTFTSYVSLIASGTLQLNDAFTCSNTLTITAGTFNANNYNVTCSALSSSSVSSPRTITMGSGLWTVTGTGTVWAVSATNLTFNKNTANILLSDTSTTARDFSAGSGVAYNKLTIGGTTGTSTLTILGMSSGTSFTELASTKTVAHTILFTASFGTIDTWSITGTSGNVVTVGSTTTSRRNFTLTNPTSGINYLSVSNIGELSANKFAVGANSTDGGNNSNVYFTASPPSLASGSMLMLF